VLQAHVHAYERLLVDGIPYFVHGARGGHLALDWNDWSPVPESQFRFETHETSPHHFGAQLITVTPAPAGSPTELTSEFYALIDGSQVLIDTTTISKVCN